MPLPLSSSSSPSDLHMPLCTQRNRRSVFPSVQEIQLLPLPLLTSSHGILSAVFTLKYDVSYAHVYTRIDAGATVFGRLKESVSTGSHGEEEEEKKKKKNRLARIVTIGVGRERIHFAGKSWRTWKRRVRVWGSLFPRWLFRGLLYVDRDATTRRKYSKRCFTLVYFRRYCNKMVNKTKKIVKMKWIPTECEHLYIIVITEDTWQ